MRIIMFLRPTNRYGTKGEYTAFRKLLLAKGFVLMQPEVFMAVAPTRRAAEQLLTHLQAQSPTTGTVCVHSSSRNGNTLRCTIWWGALPIKSGQWAPSPV